VEQLLLVNPKRRKRSRKTPPRGAGGRFLKRKSRSGTRKRRRRNPVRALAAANPIRRRRRARSAPARRRRYRRNPSARGFIGQLTAPLMPAVIGAGGAIANDIAWGFLPLPINLKSGYIGVAGKAVLAVGLGIALSRVIGQSNAKQMTAGALTVLAYQTLGPVVRGALPAAPVGEYISGIGYAGAGQVLTDMPSSLSNVPDSLREYISNSPGYSEDGSDETY
jgi:hypothetical protein